MASTRRDAVVSSPDPDSQLLRVDCITATWKVGLGNKNDALVAYQNIETDVCIRTDADVTLIIYASYHFPRSGDVIHPQL